MAIGVLVECIVVQHADLALEQGDPAFQTLLLGQRVGVRIVLDVELLEVVLGRAAQLILLGPGEFLHKKPLGSVKMTLKVCSSIASSFAGSPLTDRQALPPSEVSASVK